MRVNGELRRLPVGEWQECVVYISYREFPCYGNFGPIITWLYIIIIEGYQCMELGINGDVEKL